MYFETKNKKQVCLAHQDFIYLQYVQLLRIRDGREQLTNSAYGNRFFIHPQVEYWPNYHDAEFQESPFFINSLSRKEIVGFVYLTQLQRYNSSANSYIFNISVSDVHFFRL